MPRNPIMLVMVLLVSLAFPPSVHARQADPATQDLHAALEGYISTGAESLFDLVQSALEAGADPLAPVEAPGRRDSYAYLIQLAEDASEREAHGYGMGHDWRAAAYRVFALMETQAAPAGPAIYYLDSAVARPGAEVTFTNQAGGLRGIRDRMSVTVHAMQSEAEPDETGFIRYDWAEAYETALIGKH